MMNKTYTILFGLTIVAISFLTACNGNSEPVIEPEEGQEQETKAFPLNVPKPIILEDTNSQVSIELELDQDTVSKIEDITVKISITNESKKNIRLMLDHPKFYTGGLWYGYHFEMTDSADSSVLYSDNNAMLSSISHPNEAETNKHRRNLEPNKTLSKEFNLRSLIITKPIGQGLSEGVYRLRLKKGNIASNLVEIVIRK